MSYIDVTGKTEEEAIRKALQQLQMDRDDVSVEILERAKSGFLGIGSSPARVRVTYGQEEPEAPAAPVQPEKKPEKKPEPKPQPKPQQPKPQKAEAPKAAPKAPEAPKAAETPAAPAQELCTPRRTMAPSGTGRRFPSASPAGTAGCTQRPLGPPRYPAASAAADSPR